MDEGRCDRAVCFRQEVCLRAAEAMVKRGVGSDMPCEWDELDAGFDYSEVIALV